MPGPGVLPSDIVTPLGTIRTDTGASAANDLSGYQTTMPGFNDAMNSAMSGLNRPQIQNPYDIGMANQARPGQNDALSALMGQMQGPGVAGLAGNAAMGNALQQQVGGMAQSHSGLGQGQVMAQAGQAMGGMANDIGQARLQEFMQAQGAAAQGAGGMRGQDLSAAQEFMNEGLKAREISNANTLSSQGQKNTLDLQQAEGERKKALLLGQLNQAYQQGNIQMVTQILQALATLGMAIAKVA